MIYSREYALKDGSTLLIREARPEDADKCLAHLSAVAEESPYLLITREAVQRITLDMEEELLRKRCESESSVMLVGVIGDEIVCIANFDIMANPRLKHNASVGISVRSHHWGKGIGTCFFTTFREIAENNGVKNIFLGMYSNNERGIALYAKMGFKETGILKNRILSGEEYNDEIVMQLEI